MRAASQREQKMPSVAQDVVAVCVGLLVAGRYTYCLAWGVVATLDAVLFWVPPWWQAVYLALAASALRCDLESAISTAAFFGLVVLGWVPATGDVLLVCRYATSAGFTTCRLVILARKVEAELEECEVAQCPVCWEAGLNGKQFGCGHRLCNGCADRWLSIHHTCPECRQQVAPPPDPRVLMLRVFWSAVTGLRR